MFLINPYILNSTSQLNTAMFLIDSYQVGGSTVSSQGYSSASMNTPGWQWYIWSPPAGVTYVCVVCVGAGGGGGRGTGMGGGGGGGLIYANYIAVSPSNQYYIQVGRGGRGRSSLDANDPYYNGGKSGFGTGTTSSPNFYISANGGQSATLYSSTVMGGYAGGGGGAAGYESQGNGGNAGSPYASYSSDKAAGGTISGTTNSIILPQGFAGASGGSGGSAGKGGPTYNNGNNASATNTGQTVPYYLGAAGGGSAGYLAGAGGGVGLFGLTYVANDSTTGGAGGAGAIAWPISGSPSNGNPGGGGSGGFDGIASSSAVYGGQGGYIGGGGGGGYVSDGVNLERGSGGSGAVRIIWGANRLFPTLAT